jgi:hypothetical protein
MYPKQLAGTCESGIENERLFCEDVDISTQMASGLSMQKLRNKNTHYCYSSGHTRLCIFRTSTPYLNLLC